MNSTDLLYDTIIIGSGPAGFSAGIFTVRRAMKTLILGKELGGQLTLTSKIENYPGFRSIQNYDLIMQMRKHAEDLGVQINNEEVKQIEKRNNIFFITTNIKQYYSKTIIIAIGLSPRRLAIKGEKELTGKGVSYCVNCDGLLYKNKITAVVGGGNSALEAVEILSKITNQTYLIHRREEFRGFEAIVSKIKNRKNVKFILNSEIKEIIGEKKLEKITIFNNKTKKITELPVDGLFIEIGRIANTDLVADLVKRDEKNQIIVDEKCRTSMNGIFAAGDVTQVPYKQITIACGQGTIAAFAAYEYLFNNLLLRKM